MSEAFRGGQRVFTGIIRNISERKQAQLEREKLIADLKDSNTELERFAYTVSHDLKSPLVTVKNFLGLLREDIDAGDRSAIEADLAHMNHAADRMHHLVEDLLELSRVGRVAGPSEAVAMEKLVQEALTVLAGQIQQRGVEVEIVSELPTCYGDRSRLFQVMQNLIDNAVKYMGDQEAPQVKIGSLRRGSDLLCYVRDNGVGIASGDAEKVFDLFSQLDPDVPGSGVGLAVVKRIIEVHGGAFGSSRPGPGKARLSILRCPH